MLALAVVAASLIWLSNPFQADAQKRPQRTNVEVVDAHGSIVGKVVGISRGEESILLAHVAVSINQQVFVLSARRDRLHGPDAHATVHFESNDCSGTPYLNDSLFNPLSLIPYVAVTAPGSTLSVAQGTVQTIAAMSSISVGGACNSFSTPSVMQAVPGTVLVDLDTLFTPPFTLR